MRGHTTMASFGARHQASRRQLLAVIGKFAAASAAIPLLAACGGTGAAAPSTAAATTSAASAAASSSAPVKAASGSVVFWHPTQTLGDWIVQQYNKTNPQLKVQFVLGEFDTNTKTMATLAAGDPPDMSYLGRWQGPDLAVRNAIFAMDAKIKLAQSWKWSDVWPRLQQDSTQWGKIWVVPYATDTRAFFFNKTL